MQEKRWRRADGNLGRNGVNSAKGSGWGSRSNMSRSRRNEPWWMREEEKNNPRVLPEYKPWWADTQNSPVDGALTVALLKEEADRRKLIYPASVKKAALLELLQADEKRYDLSDAGFTRPSYTPKPTTAQPCYPEVYEGENGIAILRQKSMAVPAPSTDRPAKK